MFRHTKIAIVATVLTATGVMAYAAKTMENDTAVIAQTKISMTQAVTAAEQHANGKATRAELEQSKAGLTYDVEVVSGTQVFDVKVDAEKGTVISSAQDKIDHEGNHEGDQENQD
ncbi:MAG TPA: peptidase M4 [Polaromonas sp.]|uniref:PepSY domain-containing protein n=1 Tax=Polaromonas sp. UBA4122 TaxID=1947074 RepID=UPI000EC15076|nr:PepSY domain-containing protein [Polaromonas sp. UBA4122]HAL36676.1 peptidase M4 [Polaromonas sp.]